MDYPKPWREVKGNEARGLEKQLYLECAPEHLLYGAIVIAVARCGANDDVLFELTDKRVANVHLTWGNRRERIMPQDYPHCVIYSDLARALREISNEYADWEKE